MSGILIKHLPDYINQTATIKGWVYNLRSSGKIMFVEVRDGSGFVQAIIDRQTVGEDGWATAQSLTIESAAEFIGTVTEHPKRAGVYELHVTTLHVYHVAAEYPIGKKEHGPDFLLDHRHLWLRSQRQWAILRIRAGIYRFIQEWLDGHGFIRFDSPILTPAACEGTTTLFGVDYFDMGQAYLTQSGQLYLEAGIASLGRVYDFGPVFRAEKSKTRRHLTEFWMMDAEAAFVEHAENMEIQEQLVSYIVQNVLAQYAEELKVLERDTEPLTKVLAPFPRLTHKEAVAKLHALGSDIKEDDDLGGDDETILTKEYEKPIFIEKYPAKVKAFYMKRDPEDDTRVLCADMLAPEGYGEVIGGSQREDSIEYLIARIKEHGLPMEAFEWYLDMRRFGSVPHSGFGVGLERLVAWICKLEHVRETIPFPRMITRKTP